MNISVVYSYEKLYQTLSYDSTNVNVPWNILLYISMASEIHPLELMSILAKYIILLC